MSISAARSEQSRPETIADPGQPQPGSAAQVMYPSEVVEPSRVNTPPQQGHTQPESGSAVHTEEPGDIARGAVNVVEVPSQGHEPVPFKERVIGVAKKTRGTLLNKPELKEHGEQILEGTASVHQPATSN